jgi:RNA-directed DNA polymerase
MILIRMSHDYKNIISIKNLCDAWTEFIRGKKSKKDVAEFSLDISQNIFRLHQNLRTKTYRHGAYEAFSRSDSKPRSIHKATVRDRLLHHAIYRILYPHFDKKFGMFHLILCIRTVALHCSFESEKGNGAQFQ